jgi:UDP-2-acetamido-2,6-beta-L-arabino-hexul-4-ose reductase
LIVGITGSNGFIGYHLWVHIKYLCDDLKVIRLGRDLSEVDRCDVIVHLAEKNRGDEKEIYENNISSASTLASALGSNKRLLYASSLHEDDDTIFGKYRRENKLLFSKWAKASNSSFSSLRIPNVFGEFCKPNYNSFVATFCHKIINNGEITATSNRVKLVYVQDLCKQIVDIIREKGDEESYTINHYGVYSVKYIYDRLLSFKKQYIDNNIIPDLSFFDHDSFDLDLFNTFRSYIEDRVVTMDSHSDERGYLSETIKTNAGGQSFFSTTNPGYIRGQHFHMRKLERFCVLDGEAKINLRKIGSDEVITYRVSGNKTQFIDMPLFYTHNITPANDEEITTLFWTNELLDKNDVDTFWEDV